MCIFFLLHVGRIFFFNFSFLFYLNYFFLHNVYTFVSFHYLNIIYIFDNLFFFNYCRCILTTVDPFKGEKSKDEEPLKTLQTWELLCYKIELFPFFCIVFPCCWLSRSKKPVISILRNINFFKLCCKIIHKRDAMQKLHRLGKTITPSGGKPC